MFYNSQTQYLSLAMLSRHIIDALLDAVRSGNREKLKKALPDAIDSLSAATDSRNIALSPTATRLATSYDHVRTIDDLFSPEDRLQMIKTLKALEDFDPSSEDKQRSAREAMAFFFTLENRALQNSRHPMPKVPPHSRPLCPSC